MYYYNLKILLKSQCCADQKDPSNLSQFATHAVFAMQAIGQVNTKAKCERHNKALFFVGLNLLPGQQHRATKKLVSSDQLTSFDCKECSQVFATAPVGKKVAKKWKVIAKASDMKCFAFVLANIFFKLPQPQHCTHNGETKNDKTDH